MKPAKVSVAKAENYYYDRDAVYKQSDSRYLGTGAAALGLEGQGVGPEFSMLIRGVSPAGEKLAQRKNLPDDKAVAGTDIPLTLPKSWSMLALVDPDIRAAALEAAKVTVNAVEANGWIQGRQTKDGVTEQVEGKMVAAVFPHSASRENDAHFHVHSVFLNVTQRPDGSWSTLENHTLFEHSKDIRQIFLSEFAASEAVQKYGIELSVDRGGTVVPEVAGFDKNAAELFSKRHNEIHNADALRERLQERMPNLNSKDLDDLVQLSTRAAKNHDMTEAELIKSHQDQLKAAGLPTLEQMRENALAAKVVQEQAAGEKLTARDYVKQAAEDLSEHQSVFSRAELIQAALKQSVGSATWSQTEKAVTEAASSAEIVGYSDGKFTTPEIQKTEARVAQVAVEQREAFTPLLQDSQVKEVINQFQEKKGFVLTTGQAEAVAYTLQHTGRVGVIQGDAGAGKSSSMEAVADTIASIGREQGVSVRGLTLQGKTSVLLEGDSGISSGTIDSFLNSKSEWNGKDRQLWIVDEYSMVDSRRLGALVDRAEQENAQLILLGDKKQLAAIGAGRLGQDLDEKGLVKTVIMSESLRQKTEYAKAIDHAMKRGDIARAVGIMEAAGKLIVEPDREKRAQAMAAAYVQAEQQAREETGGKRGALAMTLTNAEREAVIQEIRTLQKEAGVIAETDHTFTTRAPVQMDAVTRKLAASYHEGMIIIPAKPIGAIEAGKEARVTSVDSVANTITITGITGHSETMDARKATKGLMVYDERQTELAVGEKVVWLKTDNTAQGKYNQIKNGMTGTIEAIGDDGRLTIKTERGHTVQIDGEGAYLTNAQAITGHKAQGATEHTGLLSISADDRLATQNMLYVLTTRQTDNLVAFVDDKQALVDGLKAEVKHSTLDYKEILQHLVGDMREQIQEITDRREAMEAFTQKELQEEQNSTRQRQDEVENNMGTGDTRRHSSDHHQESQHDQGAALAL